MVKTKNVDPLDVDAVWPMPCPRFRKEVWTFQYFIDDIFKCISLNHTFYFD